MLYNYVRCYFTLYNPSSVARVNLRAHNATPFLTTQAACLVNSVGTTERTLVCNTSHCLVWLLSLEWVTRFRLYIYIYIIIINFFLTDFFRNFSAGTQCNLPEVEPPTVSHTPILQAAPSRLLSLMSLPRSVTHYNQSRLPFRRPTEKKDSFTSVFAAE